MKSFLFLLLFVFEIKEYNDSELNLVHLNPKILLFFFSNYFYAFINARNLFCC